MDIRRIDGYDDPRFGVEVLCQHGAFLADGEPCEVRILSRDTAQIRCPEAAIDALIAEFRFYAGHIARFVDEKGRVLRAYSQVELYAVDIADVQPSQFFVSREKAEAVASFVHSWEDVIIPVVRHGGRYVSCDGHTRLWAAWQQGIRRVWAFDCTDADDVLLDFARMAGERGVHSPADLKPLSAEEYERQWNGFCDVYFAARAADEKEKESK